MPPITKQQTNVSRTLTSYAYNKAAPVALGVLVAVALLLTIATY